MPDKTKQTMSLWSVIEKMQRRLEAEGMDRHVVDAAVTTGLQALLDFAPPTRTPIQPAPAGQPRSKLPVRLTLWSRAKI
jgi:hypothetical protein